MACDVGLHVHGYLHNQYFSAAVFQGNPSGNKKLTQIQGERNVSGIFFLTSKKVLSLNTTKAKAAPRTSHLERFSLLAVFFFRRCYIYGQVSDKLR